MPLPTFPRLLAVVCLAVPLASAAAASLPASKPASTPAGPVSEYRFSFADRVHHVMQVQATFRNVPRGPLVLAVARSSPGRYAAFEFAENVFGERITDAEGRPLAVTRVDPRTWSVANPGSVVNLTYKVFGDRTDGTFFGVDASHAHINFPAVLVRAKGWDSDPVRVSFDLPKDAGWQVATQLFPAAGDLTNPAATSLTATSFSAPNLTYLMDSPTELSAFALRSFSVPGLFAGQQPQNFRVTVHSAATPAQLDAYTANIERIVREEQAVFGELPEFEPGAYTFVMDFEPWASGDGMEHRNSTSITTSRPLDPVKSLGVVAHEFFHSWNVRRIRPASLEPFNFDDVNMCGELWLAEGFTNYYGQLAMQRAGFVKLEDALMEMGYTISYVQQSPGSRFRSAVDMSRMAPFADGSTHAEPTDFENNFVSYYPFGQVVGVGLDLTLRARSNSRVTLDDFMRAMWRVHGKPAGAAPGLVAKPYTMADVQARLAEVSGDEKFAADFIARHIAGTEPIDFAPLMLRAGVRMKPASTEATLGELRLQKADGGGLRVASPTVQGSPAYLAGLDLGDTLLKVGGTAVATQDEVNKIVASHKPGDTLQLTFVRRGQTVQADALLVQEPLMVLVPVEKLGETLTLEQRQFREAWLGSKVKPKS